jgi:hypothetical protein
MVKQPFFTNRDEHLLSQLPVFEMKRLSVEKKAYEGSGESY